MISLLHTRVSTITDQDVGRCCREEGSEGSEGRRGRTQEVET
jgi:hypothetical protein